MAHGQENQRGETWGEQLPSSAGVKEARSAGWLERAVDALNVGQGFEHDSVSCAFERATLSSAPVLR